MRRRRASAGASQASSKPRSSVPVMSNLERLVYMANQIARNFEAIWLAM